MEQQCQYLAHGTWPCERKKRKIKNIGQDIYLFSLKLAFDMMIFYCRLGEGRDKGSSFEFIFKFSPFFFCIISSFPVLKKSSHFCDLRVVLFIKRFIFRIRVSGVRVSVMVWLIVANVRGDRCRAALRIRRLFHRFCKVQLHLKVKLNTMDFSVCRPTRTGITNRLLHLFTHDLEPNLTVTDGCVYCKWNLWNIWYRLLKLPSGLTKFTLCNLEN